MAAVLDDEEIAERLLSEPDGPARAMDLVGWTYDRELLAGIFEAILRLTSITIAANSKDGKVPKVTPLPRPQTAVQRVRLRLVQEDLQHVVTAFRPRE